MRQHTRRRDWPAIRGTVVDVDAIEAKQGKKLDEINWVEVASEHCRDLYRLLCHSHSTDETHAFINSLNRVIADDAQMEVSAFKIAPDTENLVEALRAACLLFMLGCRAGRCCI
jgi:hypothetical protein